MPTVRFTNALQQEYTDLFRSLEVKQTKFNALDKVVKSLVRNKDKYVAVADPLSLPWFLVAAIHNMESSQNFKKHLHNGDPLSARTRLVPKGRPTAGTPPFSWEESATDALKLKKLQRINDWSLTRLLYELERYNGWGYRLYHPEVKSPYLWSFSNHYVNGKYVADGTWSDTARSSQVGAAVIIKRMEEQGVIAPFTSASSSKPTLRFATKPLPRGEDLQRFLNTFDGVSLRVDGWTGKKTSEASKLVFGFYLSGDPDT